MTATNPFAPESIAAETTQFNHNLEEMLATVPSVIDVPPEATRQAREAGQGIFGPLVRLDELAQTRAIEGSAGPIPLRIFTPETIDGVLLHIHGGGWVIGGAHHQDPYLWELATQANLAVVSVEYRLAPEHPYPAGPDDCETAALWLVHNAAQEFGTKRLLIGGESAGAHLSTVTLLRMRDRHGYTGFRGANLVYGVYDLTMTPSAYAWGERYLILSGPIMRWFADHFVPAERRRQPDVSPLYADLAGLPPALFTVGTLDPLRDDSLFMHQRWLAANNEAELAVYPGGVHAFNMMPLEIARQANARMAEFLAAV